jgi:hypothetical protein
LTSPKATIKLKILAALALKYEAEDFPILANQMFIDTLGSLIQGTAVNIISNI